MTGPNRQANALRRFAASLANAGVEHAVLSPGSRNAPLILALARCPGLTATSLIDERTAGFYALGISKANGRPAVVACTSGTAAAELAPAVHEAREAGTPLIILTADRPPELRAAGANQTIDQNGVFGSAAVMATMPAFDGGDRHQWSLLARSLVSSSMEPTPRPVHLNVPLWDPLAAEPDNEDERLSHPDIGWLAASKRAGYATRPVRGAPKTVVVAGRDEHGFEDGLAQAAASAGIPLIADPLSGSARAGSAVQIENWDSLLRFERWATLHRPDAILRTGDLPTSEPIRNWLAASRNRGSEVIHFDPLDSRRDPLSINSERIEGALTPCLAGADPGDAAWLQSWIEADEAASRVTDATLEAHSESEPALARAVSSAMPEGSILFSAASMPVRDLEAFGVFSGGVRALANRGANGIDGTIATAAGVAAASGRPTLLLTGDVTFAHDVASLAAARDLPTPFAAVVIENGGGAIFDALPISERSDVYENFIFTPPRLDIGSACAAWGINYLRLDSVGEAGSLASGLSDLSAPIIASVELDRNASASARVAVRDAVAAALLQA